MDEKKLRESCKRWFDKHYEGSPHKPSVMEIDSMMGLLRRVYRMGQKDGLKKADLRRAMLGSQDDYDKWATTNKKRGER